MGTQLSLSVSLVVYDLNEQELRECIGSLEESIQRSREIGIPIDWHLTLVDNGSNQVRLNTFINSNVTVTHNQSNVGFGAAHNQVIAAAESELHLILNPDVILAKDSLEALLKLLINNPQVVMVGPRGETGEGENAYLCKRFPSLFVLLLRGFMPSAVQAMFTQPLAHYECRDLDQKTPTIGVELISGCCTLARTSVLKQLEGFDVGYFLYFEDFDLCIRASRLGEIAYQPLARITHYGGNSARKGFRHIWYFSRSAFRFFTRHRR
ncbi:MAG: glycosyltransferase family 2 protein [Gammaproteobacteria bacterium]|mgnify:CR=1 FL=1|jgi:GT2 family glycosyltransferase|nr:glycosyltransferase family 2 protein [Gammaproteobacteria bacterium]MBT4493751.1 glycosyltransferase family 2 protein [Gammaproteobacteria bacterium]MBT7371479.1 glycosyltransferase family 2 protein [Gammaproteobacteria bacterium]